MAEDQPPVDASTEAALNELAELTGAQPGAPSPTAQAPAPPTPPAPPPTTQPPPDPAAIDQAAIDEILRQASFEDAAQIPDSQTPTPEKPASSTVSSPTPPTPLGEPVKLPNFQQVMQEAQVNSIDLLRDVDLNVKIELGRSRMLVEDVLKLGEGSVVELDKLAGDPVDVFINERLVARGEVLVLNDNFCVRINEIVAGVKEEGL